MFRNRAKKSSGNELTLIKKSATLEKLSTYLIENFDNFETKIKISLQQYKEIVSYLSTSDSLSFKSLNKDSQFNVADYQDVVEFGYSSIKAMLHIDHKNYELSCEELQGTYLSFRHSVNKGSILVNLLKIRPRNESKNWEFVTAHADQFGDIKKSDGIVIPIQDNVYMIGDIEMGKGIDFFAMTKPFSKNQKKMSGFHVSVDNSNRLLFSKTIMFRAENGVDFRIDDDEYLKSDIFKKTFSVKSSDWMEKNYEFGRQIMAFLHDVNSEKVIRPDARVPGINYD